MTTLTDILTLGLITYGLTLLITGDSLLRQPRLAVQEWATRTNNDPNVRRPWRTLVTYSEELIFCHRCISYWIALTLVIWQTDGLDAWQTILVAFAARTVALIAWRIIDTNVTEINR